MVAAGIPWAVTSLYLSEVRILHRHVATVAITGALTIGIVAPALVLVPERRASTAPRPPGSSATSPRPSWPSSRSGSPGPATPTDPALTEPETAEDAAEVGITLEHM